MLILDIETAVAGKIPNPAVDIFRFIGCYEVEDDKYHFYSYKDHDIIKNLIKKHRVIITFNGDHYDIPILKRTGLYTLRHLSIDLRVIMKKRGELMKAKNITFSLSNLAKFFNLETKKMEDFNYDILKKDEWTNDELLYIKTYTMQDIDVTKQLYDKIHHFFKSFKTFVNKNDIYNYRWLTTSIGVYSYKVICHLAGMEEQYGDFEKKSHYKGGFVALPSQGEAHGDVYCLDFNSLYPHNYIQGNLYSYNCKCCSEQDKWKGNELFPVVGKYCSKKNGKIENILQRIYNLRKEYKQKGMHEQYALKTVMNTMYGISGNPAFKNVFNESTASDCTLIGRCAIKLARQKFKDAGYNVLYTDTDSVFIQDIYKDKERLLMIKQSLINQIKNNLPFPSQTFDMGIDEEIKHIWFFKSGEIFKKKHYMYVNINDKIVIKGLPLIKSDSSKLSKLIFDKYMKETIINGNIIFKYNDVKTWIYSEIKNNLEITARQFKVWDLETYKQKRCIQATISKKYGVGRHLLIPNRYKGVGQSVKYCTVDEFIVGKYNPSAIILNKTWNELSQFLDFVPQHETVKKRRGPQTELRQWANI